MINKTTIIAAIIGALVMVIIGLGYELYTLDKTVAQDDAILNGSQGVVAWIHAVEAQQQAVTNK